MTSDPSFSRRQAGPPTLPVGDVLGTYDTYPEAQQVVDRLARAEFDVTKVAIVGNDLKTVERVTGRLTWGRAAIAGLVSGAWFGLFGGILLSLLSPAGGLEYALAAVGIGAGFGILFGIVSYGLTRRRRDFTSTHQVIASNYQVLVPSDQVVRAQMLLQRSE